MNKKEQAKNKIDIGKKAFDIYVDSACQDSYLEDYAKEVGVSVKKLKQDFLIPYKNRFVKPKPTDEQLIIYNGAILTRKQSRVKDEIDTNFIRKLLSLKYVKEVVEYISGSEYSIGIIYRKIRNYINANPSKTDDTARLMKVDGIIKNYIQSEGINNQKSIKVDAEKNDALETIETIIEEFLIEETESLEDIIDKYKEKINYRTFSKYLDELQKGTDEQRFLFNRLVEKIEKDKNNFDNLMKEIIFNIKNGVLTDIDTVPFSILDYYKLTRITPSRFLDMSRVQLRKRVILKADYDLLEEFFSKYKSGSSVMNETDLLALTQIMGERGITIEDRMSIIDYLKKETIPLTKNTYDAAYKLYVTGKITKEA